MSSVSLLKDRILFNIRTIVTLTDGGEMQLTDAIIKDVVEAVEGIYGDSDGLREFASTGSNQVDNPTVIMYEDWSVRPDGTYYRYRFEGETEWHEKLTGHKGSPFVKFVRLSQTEVNDLVERKLIEPPKTHTKSAIKNATRKEWQNHGE